MESKIYVAITVWGKGYIDTFFTICLPSMVVGSNFDFLAEKMKVIFLIYTKDEDVAYVMNQLPSILNIEFRVISFLQFGKNDFLPKFYHKKVTECYLHALNVEKEKHAPIILGCPDIFFSSGVGKRIYRSLKKGKQCLLLITARVNEEEFILQLKKQFSNFPQTSIEPKQLAHMMFENMHVFSKTQFDGLKKGNAFPSMRFWQGSDNYCIAKSFHLHPFLVTGEWENFSSGGTIDGKGGFLEQITRPFDKTDVIQDISEGFICELSSKNSMQPNIKPIRMSLYHIFAKQYVGPINKKLFQRFSMSFYSEEISKELKEETFAKVNQDVKEIMDWINAPTLWQRLICFTDFLRFYFEKPQFHKTRKVFLLVTLFLKVRFPRSYKIFHRILRGKRTIQSLENADELKEYLGREDLPLFK